LKGNNAGDYFQQQSDPDMQLMTSKLNNHNMSNSTATGRKKHSVMHLRESSLGEQQSI
jgi:hypothetical protein